VKSEAVQTLSLYELNSLVREVIECEMAREYWVEAELSEVRESRGHCYMELVQKEDLSNTPIAKASARCWRSSWSMIQPHFERITQQHLHPGMKVRLKVYAQFHEAFGFSWIVTDIDPNYTLGDMARRRQQIIAQLKQEGIFDLQRELSLPLFCLRIAVISSETAAGYGDFCHQLDDSPFVFHTELFPAVMQGEQVEQSIINALNRIYEASSFDCVVIIRGGGATSDMSGFDTLALAENVAQFPLPIITGIGHDRDECVLDMVSHVRVKTPTAAAAFLIDHAQQVLDRIDQCEQRISYIAQTKLSALIAQLSTLSTRIPTLFSLVRTQQEARLGQTEQRLKSATHRTVDKEHNKLVILSTQLPPLIAHLLSSHRHRLELLEQRVASLDPQQLLRRGYSITTLNGKSIRNAKELKTGDEIITRLSQGSIKSIVK
jgi:exodeoxyribonuclease VII large subunit